MDLLSQSDGVDLNHLRTHEGIRGRYKWHISARNVCYLYLILDNISFNQTIAKVYLCNGQVVHSIKVNLTENPDYDFIMHTIWLEQEYLQRVVAKQIAERMEG